MSDQVSTTDNGLAAQRPLVISLKGRWNPGIFSFNGRMNDCVLVLSPLVVAFVVAAGLGFLCAKNLSGGAGVRQIDNHSAAIHKLLFRS